MQLNRLECLKRFNAFQKNFPGPIDHSISFNFGMRKSHLLFNAIMHGDEFGTLPAFLRVIEEIIEHKLKCYGKVTFTLGNVPAFEKNVRFIEEDLNREFTTGIVSSKEGVRAAALASVIRTATIFIDFHQTICPTKDAFFLFKNCAENHGWARRLSEKSFFVTSESETPSVVGKQTAIEYAGQYGIPAIVFEVSQKGWDFAAEKKTYNAITRALEFTEATQENPHILKIDVTRKLEAKHLKIVYREPFGCPDKKLKEGLVNLQEVEKEEVVGHMGDKRVITVPMKGYILFPKYPERDAGGGALGSLSESLFVIAQPI